jgi:ABC-2 type transport system ATP-binding protein
MVYGGRLIALGSPAELKHQYSVGTLLEVRARPLLDALDVLVADGFARDVTIFGQAMHATVGTPEEAAAVRRLLEEHGLAVEDVAVIVPSLEDVFVGLIEAADRESQAKEG